MGRQISALIFTATIASLMLVAPARAATITGVAAMGASETAGRNFSGSWVPWLAEDRGINFGPNQSYNVAINGSRTQSLLNRGQHTDVADLVANGNVNLAYLFIGGLDVGPALPNILLGNLTIEDWADGMVDRMMTAVDTVLAEGPEGMIVAGIPDMTLVPGATAFTSVPGLPELVTDAIDYTNTLIRAEVLSRQQVYLDVAGLMREMNSEPLIVGGVTIDTVSGNPDPTHFFTDDIHPGFVGNGWFANLMLTAMNDGFGTSHALFTDQEILARAGLSAFYTGETSDIDFSNFVRTVPEPTSVLFLCSAGVLACLRRRRR